MSVIINMTNSAFIFCIRSNRSTADMLLLILINERFSFISISLAVSLSLFQLTSHASHVFCERIFLYSELLCFMLIVLVQSDVMWLFRLFAEQYI